MHVCLFVCLFVVVAATLLLFCFVCSVVNVVVACSFFVCLVYWGEEEKLGLAAGRQPSRHCCILMNSYMK